MSEKEYATTSALDRVENNLIQRIEGLENHIEKRIEQNENMIEKLAESQERMSKSLEKLEGELDRIGKKIDSFCGWLAANWMKLIGVAFLMWTLANGFLTPEIIQLVIKILLGSP